MSRLDQALSHEIFCIDSYWTETARSWCYLDFRDFLVYISTWGTRYVRGTFSPSSQDTSYWVPCTRVGQCDQQFYSRGVGSKSTRGTTIRLSSKLVEPHFFAWFWLHSFATELLDYLQLGSRSTFAGVDKGVYLKAMHQKKNWWCPRLRMCIKGCTVPIAVEFTEKVLLNLLSMHDEAYYTVLYIGESLNFQRRMSNNDPARFLSWFPTTHTFMLAWLSPVQRIKGTNKAAFLGL